MEKDTQKRILIEKQLAKHPELEYSIWKAVEGRKLSEQEQKEEVLPEFYSRYGRNATLPAVGCALSHIGVYRDMVSDNVHYALILEDDALLSSDLKLDAISKILDSEEPRVVLLTPDFWYHKKAEKISVDGKYNIYRLADGYMTSGYAINTAAAQLLSSKLFPIQYVADAWGTFLSFGLKLYGIVPHVISYPEGYGEIGSSQHREKTIYERLRFVLVYVYIRLIRLRHYLNGYRMSQKKWC